MIRMRFGIIFPPAHAQNKIFTAKTHLPAGGQGGRRDAIFYLAL
jgi:hypothetical protein